MKKEDIQEVLLLLDYIGCMDRTAGEMRKNNARRLRKEVAKLLDNPDVEPSA